ncbi:MAG TPA: Fic family protein [Chitinophagales bacterium]|nr:Fic family protein [Chitinophagales bacterium]
MNDDKDNSSWTPLSEDNLLGLTDNDLINQHEAKGIAKAELYIFNLDENADISVPMIQEIHRIAFGELYHWGGKWRTTQVSVGQLEPPSPQNIPNLIYQYVDNLNLKIANSKSEYDDIDALVYGHYEFVRIHPFNNGNGRTGRIIMNLVALKLGYKPLELYQRKGNARTTYINSMRQSDKGDFEPLKGLIKEELTRL